MDLKFIIDIKKNSNQCTWIVSQNRTTPDWPTLCGAVVDRPGLGLHAEHAAPVPPLCVQDVAGDKPEEEIEDGDDCTELCGLVFAQPEELVLPDN